MSEEDPNALIKIVLILIGGLILVLIYREFTLCRRDIKRRREEEEELNEQESNNKPEIFERIIETFSSVTTDHSDNTDTNSPVSLRRTLRVESVKQKVVYR